MFDDGLVTETSKAQGALEKKVLELYQEMNLLELGEIEQHLVLLKGVHIKYLQGGLGQLPAGKVLSAWCRGGTGAGRLAPC